MKEIKVSDGGRRFSLLLKEDIGLLTELHYAEEPAHVIFISWWKQQCSLRKIPYTYGVAEPQGHRIVKKLLEKHSLEELQELAIHCMLEHGDRLRENPAHFAFFSSLRQQLVDELKEEGSNEKRTV